MYSRVQKWRHFIYDKEPILQGGKSGSRDCGILWIVMVSAGLYGLYGSPPYPGYENIMKIERIGKWNWAFPNPSFIWNKKGWWKKYWVPQLEAQLFCSISQSSCNISELVFNQSCHTFLIVKYVVKIRVLRMLT